MDEMETFELNSEIQLDALIEAILIKVTGVTEGYRPTWGAFQDRADEMQSLLNDDVYEVKELYKDILSERLEDIERESGL